MAFKMKGISSLTNNSLSKQIVKSNSPLLNTDPSGKSFAEINEEIEITNSVKDLQGDDFATERTITKKGQEVEKQLVPEDFEGGKNNPEYQKKLAALEIAMEQGKDAKYKDQKIDQVRDYTSGLHTRPGAEYEGKLYKSLDGKPGGDEAFEMGGFLAGRLNAGGGDGDEKTYITDNEAMEYFRKYNNPDRPDQLKKGITGDKKDRKLWINNYFNWRKQQGLPEISMSYQKDYEPTKYGESENKGKNWKDKN